MESANAEDQLIFSAEAILAHARHLASEPFQGRKAGTPFERRAAEYVATQLDTIGVAPVPTDIRVQQFPLAPGPNAPVSRNVLGLIAPPGEHDGAELIVLGAHMDHLGRTEQGSYYPGAEDNASGVAVVLEIASALQRKRADLRRGVVIAFFGAEEIGLVGSQWFVKRGPIKHTRFVAMVNVDMIGRPLVDQTQMAWLKKLLKIDSLNSVGVVGTQGRPFFKATVEEACQHAQLTPYGTQAALSPIVKSLARNRADHSSFESVGIPTLFFGSGESNDYHQPTDTIDKLQGGLMARRAQVIFESVLTLATAPLEKLPPRKVLETKTPADRLQESR